MAIEPTRFSRVSTGWRSSTQSLAGADIADTGNDFSCINGAATGTWTVTGAQVQSGAATFSSTVSVAGQATLTGGLAVGGGSLIDVFSSGTCALSFGAIAPLESSSVQTFACSGVTRGDAVLLGIDSNWPNAAANRDISFFASSSSTVGEAHAWAINSTLTSVTPTAATFARWVRISGGNYPAA